jgi:hypothetical protein
MKFRAGLGQMADLSHFSSMALQEEEIIACVHDNQQH